MGTSSPGAGAVHHINSDISHSKKVSSFFAERLVAANERHPPHREGTSEFAAEAVGNSRQRGAGEGREGGANVGERGFKRRRYRVRF
jgi:hypothetical protein